LGEIGGHEASEQATVIRYTEMQQLVDDHNFLEGRLFADEARTEGEPASG
jgi:hypothetical protein